MERILLPLGLVPPGGGTHRFDFSRGTRIYFPFDRAILGDVLAMVCSSSSSVTGLLITSWDPECCYSPGVSPIRFMFLLTCKSDNYLTSVP